MKPGRFMSWRNTGNKHCLATSSEARRRFLGPVVLDSAKSSFIPVVDILVRPEGCVVGPACCILWVLRGSQLSAHAALHMLRCAPDASCQRCQDEEMPSSQRLLFFSPAASSGLSPPPQAPPALPCVTPSPTCVDGVACVPAGNAATGTSYCCTGSIFWAPGKLNAWGGVGGGGNGVRGLLGACWGLL